MATRKYKSHATSRRFKERGVGAQASERRLTEQTTRNVESIKLAKIQSKEASQNFISGLSDKLRFEEGVLSEKHKLEGKVRQHKFAALQKKAETDVARLEGEAKQKKEYSEWISALAPKFAKNIAKLGGNLWDLSDQIRGKSEWLEQMENGNIKELNDGTANAHWSLARNATDDSIQLSEEGEVEGSNALIDGTINFSTRWAQNQFANYIINNRKSFIAEITAKFDHDDTKVHQLDANGKVIKDSGVKPLYGEKTAVEMLDFGARQILKQAGISDRSEAGVKIINAFNKWGNEAAYNFNLTNQAEATKSRIQKAWTNFLNVNNDGEELSIKERQVTFEAFVTSVKNGFYSTNGRINDPRKGESMSWGDAVITAIKYDADRSIGGIKGLSTVDDVYTYLGGLMSINNGKEKPVPITEKFRHRIDNEVVPHLETLIKNNVDKRNKKLKANGGREELKLQRIVDKRTKDGDEFTEPERLEQIIKISKLTDIDEGSRSNMYKLLQYDSSKIPDTAKYVDYRTSMESGDEFRAQSILLTIPKEKRGALTKDIEVFNRIRQENGTGWQGYIDSSTTTFNAKVKQKWKGNLLLTTDSSDKALIFFQGRVLDKVRSGMTLSEANESELKLLDEGLSGKGGDNHPYNTIKGRLEPKEFTMFMGNDAKTSYAVDIYLKGREKSDAKWDEIKDTSLIELDYNTDFRVALLNPNEATSTSRGNSLLENARLVSPDNIESIRSILESNTFLGPDADLLGDIIPINVKRAADHLGMTHVEAMNHVLKNTFGTETVNGEEVAKYRINADGQTAAVIFNNGETVHDRDIPGTNMINACKAQNILPITELNRYTVDFNVAPNEAWSKVKGIEFTTDEFGSFQTSDFSKFVKEGGYRLNDFPFKDGFLDSCGFRVIQSFQNKVKGI